MKDLKVQATVPEKRDASGKLLQAQIGPYTITVKSGATAKESIELFGDEAVHSNADANWVKTLQASMRTGMKRGWNQAQLQANLGSAKMGVAQRSAPIDPKQAFLAMYAAATPEEQKRMIAELTARAAK